MGGGESAKRVNLKQGGGVPEGRIQEYGMVSTSLSWRNVTLSVVSQMVSYMEIRGLSADVPLIH